MPFWDLAIFDRYVPQMEAIAKKCDKFHIVYRKGEPDSRWPECFTFHEIRLPWWPSYAKWVWGVNHVWKQVCDIDVDLYYSLSGIWFQHYSAHFARSGGKPYVLRLRGDDRAAAKHQRRHPLKMMLFNRLYRRSFGSATLVVPIADRLKPVAEFYGTAAERIGESVPNGVDTDLFKPLGYSSALYPDEEWRDGPGQDSIVVGYAGRLSPEKGSSFLKALMEVTPEVRYIIAGSNQSGITFPSNCRYLGVLPHMEMPSFYNSCDMLVLPSLTEGVPNTLLEAYACGKPMMGSSEAFPLDSAIYGWRLPLDVKLWAKCVRRLSLHRDALREIGAKARRYAGQYSWSRFGQRMLMLFEEAIARKKDEP